MPNHEVVGPRDLLKNLVSDLTTHKGEENKHWGSIWRLVWEGKIFKTSSSQVLELHTRSTSSCDSRTTISSQLCSGRNMKNTYTCNEWEDWVSCHILLVSALESFLWESKGTMVFFLGRRLKFSSNYSFLSCHDKIRHKNVKKKILYCWEAE